MHNTAENAEVGLSQLIYSANKIYRFEAGKAIDNSMSEVMKDDMRVKLI